MSCNSCIITFFNIVPKILFIYTIQSRNFFVKRSAVFLKINIVFIKLKDNKLKYLNYVLNIITLKIIAFLEEEI